MEKHIRITLHNVLGFQKNKTGKGRGLQSSGPIINNHK